MSTVGCLLTVYQRPRAVERQLRALEAQSVPVKEIRIWQNVPPEAGEVPRWPVPHVVSYPNAGVWPRFLYGMELDTEFVCVFDDDTIPGRRWIENCLQQMEQQPGLYGTVGVRFPRGGRASMERFGWPRPERRVRRVDIVGHSWFFRRDWLRYYALEPRATDYDTCGEDYHFSVAVQKHLGLSTYTPPHPPDQREWWGSTAGHLGEDRHALSARPGENSKKRETHEAYRRSGWKLVAELEGRVLPNGGGPAPTPAPAGPPPGDPAGSGPEDALPALVIPPHPYTPREQTVVDLLKQGEPRLHGSVSWLNIGMSRPERDCNHWWVKLCRANRMIPHVLEVHPPNCRALQPFGLAVTQGDVREIERLFPPRAFDVVLWWHGPQHLEKDEGARVLRALQRTARRLVVLGSPQGFTPQGAVGGNPHEVHRSGWRVADYRALGYEARLIEGLKSPSGSPAHITAWWHPDD